MAKLINARNITRFVFIVSVTSLIYVIIGLITAPIDLPEPDMVIRVKYDYFVLLLLCLFGTAALFLPEIISRKARISIPNTMIISYALFVFCGIYCGNVMGFYDTVPHWDTMLHAISGALLCLLGISIVMSFGKTNSGTHTISPVFTVVFAFCFAAAIGVFWEIAEFTMDSVLGINTQGYAAVSGEPHVGQAALMDTMKDYIFNTIGAAVYAVYGYKSLKRKNPQLNKWVLKKIEG